MIPDDRIIEDGDTSESLIDVGPVTQEEADRADELFKNLQEVR